MAKRLNTSVHLIDPETGENRMVGPNTKLSRADVKTLRDGWGKRADDFFDDDGEDDDGEREDGSEAARTELAKDKSPEAQVAKAPAAGQK